MQAQTIILGTATPGGGFPLYGGAFAEAVSLGLEADRDFKAVYLDKAGDGPLMIADGRVAALWGAGIGWPGFDAVASGPAGARFIVPDAGEIARILARHPFLKPLTVAAESYPGQDAPIHSVGSWSYVLARPGFPAELAYRLARALPARDRSDPTYWSTRCRSSG